MKILTLFGTRPEIIRLSLIIRELDRYAEQILVHTGQNYDPNLSQMFLDQLQVRALNYHLGIRAVHLGSRRAVCSRWWMICWNGSNPIAC